MKPGFRVSASFLLFLLLCGLLPLAVAGCAGSADASPMKVTHYYAAGCGECEQNKALVASLEKDFPGQVSVEHLDAKAPDSVKTVSMLGFRDQGLVIRSRRGAVLWKASSHNLKMDEVREQIKGLIAHQQASM
ncbi:MAG: hypothetical protein ABUT39_21590 [Acidobacteriota bacterium]